MTIFGCSSGTASGVRHQATAGFDTVSYARYHIVDNQVADAPRLEGSFRLAVERALHQRGYQRSADKHSADLLVSVKLLLQSSEQPQTLRPGSIAGGGSPADVAALGDVRLPAYPQRNKTVVVLLQDAQNNRVLWVGWSSMRVHHGEIETRAIDALVRIMRRVPARSVSTARHDKRAQSV